MNTQHRAIRAALSAMSPRRAIAYVQSFELPEEEERCLIERDIKRHSCIEVASLLNVSVETVKKRRQAAYRKIADYLEN
jgi:DNA-directed RNA polymerase specialized sigma24 family protein